jgi:hypothetical protein
LEKQARESLPLFPDFPSSTNCANKFYQKLHHLAQDLQEQNPSFSKEALETLGRTLWIDGFTKERESLLQTKQKEENS